MKDAESTDLELIRDYPVALTRLWRAVTEPLQLMQWFGPEGVYIDRCQIDFRQTGPWECVMVGKQSGQAFHVSGQITHVAPPEGSRGSLGLTWAWHDDTGARGSESHVMFVVEETEAGARLTLTHRDLPSVEAAQDHTQGWLSTLRKLDTYFDMPARMASQPTIKTNPPT